MCMCILPDRPRSYSPRCLRLSYRLPYRWWQLELAACAVECSFHTLQMIGCCQMGSVKRNLSTAHAVSQIIFGLSWSIGHAKRYQLGCPTYKYAQPSCQYTILRLLACLQKHLAACTSTSACCIPYGMAAFQCQALNLSHHTHLSLCFMHVCKFRCMATQALSARALALLLMASHHPIVTRVWRSPRKAWTVEAGHIQGVEELIAGEPQLVFQGLLHSLHQHEYHTSRLQVWQNVETSTSSFLPRSLLAILHQVSCIPKSKQ